MSILKTILPLLLKLAPIVLACVASGNWAALWSPEGRDLIQTLLWVGLPGLFGVASAGGALYVDSREKQAALMADPPIVAAADETLVSLDAPGVSLRAKLANAAASDPEFRKRVCAAVQNALEVRGGK